MKIVDLNVLLYAVNENAPHHRTVSAWWLRALNDEDPLGLPWIVLAGFLRIATRAGVFARPLAPHVALDMVQAWLALDVIRVVVEKEDHWPTLRALLEEVGTAGNLVTDAHLAALAIGHGATLVSCDSDFGRFRGLRWLNPLDVG